MNLTITNLGDRPFNITDCTTWDDPNECKDDNTVPAMWTFGILLCLTIAIIGFWGFNVYLLNKSGRLKRTNQALLLFQLTSLLTLICKALMPLTMQLCVSTS